jgi:lysozyme family protein
VPVDVAPKLFDCIFALGPSVLRQLQRELGIAETGVMDAQTIEALRRADPGRVLAHLRFLQAYVYAKFVAMQPDRRMKFLRGLIQRAVS